MISIEEFKEKYGYDISEISFPQEISKKTKLENETFGSCDIENMYRDEIKYLDKLYLNADSTTLQENIKSLLFFNFNSSYVCDQLLIFIINKYKDKLSNEFLFDFLFKNRTKEGFEKYLDIHKERLREYIKNTEFCLAGTDYNKKFLSGIVCYNSFYYFCNQFQNELNLSPDDWNSLFKLFKNDELQKMVINSLENKGEMFNYFNKSTVLIEFLSTNQEISFDLIFKKCIEVMKINNNFISNSVRFAELEQIFRRKIKSGEFINESNSFTYQYFYKLQFLESVPAKLRKEHPFYEEGYKIFFDIIYTKIKDLTKDDLYMVRNLFNRIINGRSFLLIASINNKASLYLYYKTNLLFENKNNIDYTLIDCLSYKEWSSIANKFMCFSGGYLQPSLDPSYDLLDLELRILSASTYVNNFLCGNNENIVMPDLLVECCLKFGYKFIMKYFALNDSNVIAHISFKMYSIVSYSSLTGDYKKQVKKFLFECLNEKDLTGDAIVGWVTLFDYLYKNNYSKLNLRNIKLLSTDISSLLFPNNYHIKDSLNRLDFVAKGYPYIEKVKGIVLYNNYRKRIFSSIPNYASSYNDLEFGVVDMHDVNILSNGIGKFIYPENKFASSCLTPNGKAASCLEHGAINSNGRFFAVKKDGKIIAYSWMWRCGNVLCFDNIELNDDYQKINNNQWYIYYIYSKAAQDIVNISKSKEQIPIKLVILGRNPIDVKNHYLDNCTDVEKKYKTLFKPLQSEKLYIKDSSQKQVILVDTDEKVEIEDVKPIYLVSRNKVVELQEDMRKVNSIYFDYCIENCIKYEPLNRDDFKKGYIGDDWFYGVKKDGTTVLFEIFNDDRRKEEIKCYTTSSQDRSYQISICKPERDKLNFLLDSNNYCYDINELREYLKSIQQYLKVSKDDFFHSSRSIYNYMKILMDGQISSAEVRNDSNYGLNNGRYFISVAKMYSEAYEEYKNSLGFLLNEDILTFDTEHSSLIRPTQLDFLKNSNYYIRPGGISGEKQVYGSIPLDKVKAVMLPNVDVDFGRTIYIAEECGFDFTFIHTDTKKIVDTKELKRLIKIK